MSKLETYKGSVTLISGITQKNNGTFPLMEANAILVDDSDTRLDTLLTEIKEKQAASESSLTELDSAIKAEVTRATGEENIIKTSVSNESSARETADQAIQKSVDDEVIRAKGIEEELRKDLNSEISARQTAISTVSRDLEAETTRATGVEATLTTKIDNEVARAVKAESDLNTKVTDETTARTTADTALQEALESEVTTRTSEIEGLQTAIDDEVARAKGVESTNTTNISNIKALIPNQASTINQLADKAFVNSSITAIAADFIGNFATKAALDDWQVANPGKAQKYDYAVVEADETHSNETWRYVYQTAWEAQYKVNNAPFTAAQNAAINSGATEVIINSIADKLDASAVVNTTGSSITAPISQNAATVAIGNVNTALTTHTSSKENPHNVTKAQIGLDKVNNTSDADKPISAATQTALDGKLDKVTSATTYTQMYATDTDGTQIMLNTSDAAVASHIVKRTTSGDINVPATPSTDNSAASKSYIDELIADTYSATNPPPYPVLSVNGKIGAVTITDSDTKVTAIANAITGGKLKTTITLSDDTRVESAEISLPTTDISGKVDKVTSTSTLAQAYGKLANGTQTMLNISQGTNVSSLAQRTATGTVKGAAAIADDDLVTKAQMDTAIAGTLKNNAIINRVTELPTTIDETTADFILVEA